jgi:hypothetical protein
MQMTLVRAITRVAESQGWDERSTDDLGLMLWALFRYYAHRLGSSEGAAKHG